MDMKEFIEQYAKNLYQTLENHGYAIESAGLQCNCCPLRRQCEKSAEVGDNTTCGEYIQSKLTDGKEFRAR